MHCWSDCIVMATSKVYQKPTLLATKDDFMRVDRKMFKSRLGVLWMAQKSNWFLLSSLQHVL